MQELKVIGYYISEIINAPKYLSEWNKTLLSVSECIGELHPKWSVLSGTRDEKEEYRNKLGLTIEHYIDMTNDFCILLHSKMLDSDRRFYDLADAKRIYTRYFGDKDKYKLVSVSTTNEFYNILNSITTQSGSYSNAPLSTSAKRGKEIGCDILGWENGIFHSFLCNSLHKELSDIRANDIGLIDNNYIEVIQAAESVDGLGEPVIWMPCVIGECSI
ncbi:MAG: hypothetical protein E7478_01825 [Ruminococcaceae bacterium]|nr:hypothetical protein [Oscillospiraceae bacterium]